MSDKKYEVKTIIQEKLSEIEKAENVRIIMAIESGSRAWGFASPDSDYDVRFIYVRNELDYLKLHPDRDVIEWQLDDVLDINGWDLKKALQLLYKSNPTLFEWCSSPIVYKDSEQFAQLQEVLPTFFSEKKSLFHYWHMAETAYKTYLTTEEVRLKKYFYVLRPILAAKWVLKYKSSPPMQFIELYDSMLCEELKPEVKKLLDKKMQSPEVGMSPRIDVLNDYIDKSLAEIKSCAENIAEEKENDIKILDEFFVRQIRDGR